MKRVLIILLSLFAVSFAGRLGIGFSGGSEYTGDYTLQNYSQLRHMFYGGEFHISAEALPFMFIEPVGLIFNDARINGSVPGVGLRINIAPRLGKFFLAPFFGVEGDILFYNSHMDFNSAMSARRLGDYFEGSSPKTLGSGYGGLSVYFGKTMSFDCQYRYISFDRNIGVEMAWAGLTFYINW